MPVYVACPRCGAAHPSRVKARSAWHFALLNPSIGTVEETCPTCGERAASAPGARAWRAAPPSRLRSTAGRPTQ